MDSVDQLLCESCGVVEDEYHVLIDCNMYRDIRHNLFNEITTVKWTSENNPVTPSLLKFYPTHDIIDLIQGYAFNSKQAS